MAYKEKSISTPIIIIWVDLSSLQEGYQEEQASIFKDDGVFNDLNMLRLNTECSSTYNKTGLKNKSN